ncbi:hypothetical protein SMACR_04027 [Sordaria macrospora]|uniref:WGS project CABT00000000 data, contig 2.17 n=2 Tax=Sordaria macrospora TaxID=5147 RepID=F7W0M4_SORMK|nr:uncharacterized protein SMAC_04027 [Sordaria macrospora k-hell]KAA8631298.1 hypothetical protein SMACR_04027 [Sordaria macrospora]KAH7633364.1 hypothetical protein B0T09DRAFT_258372 [Sordaria sp. MPI-SDFR-AT-0083]WPJ60230.1 hypothetical protein SMAC4_04027 [Sordaria macrospora]CCC11324.1 unnamed protein product [Sordaria macrospora k-hell]
MPSPPPLPNHLIIVCGHAIWLDGPANGWDESEWLIEPYKKGETPTFIAHIKAGVEELAKDDRAVLMFSGGPTRPETPLSEAQSYYNLALANSFFGLSPASSPSTTAAACSFTDRIHLEERALDSYYNILFSLIHYWRVVHPQHAWPERITIVSHTFKRNRLVDGHCAAIFGLDPSSSVLEERVRFVGINPPGVDAVGGVAERDGDGGSSDVKKKEEAMQGVQLALGQWAEDPHGVGEELAGKRRARNCWGVEQRLFFSEEERKMSAVETRILEDGSEVLVDGEKPRPWAI